MEKWRHGDMDIETSNRKWKTEAQVIFLNLFTVCSSCKRKFVVRPFVNKANRLNGLIRLNRLNGLNGLAHLCLDHVYHLSVVL